MKTKLSSLAMIVGALLVSAPASLLANVPGPALTSVANKVRHELVMLPYYSIFDNLKYQVDGSTVTLTGAVTRPSLKTDAGRVVARIPGVSSVVNNIEVLHCRPSIATSAPPPIAPFTATALCSVMRWAHCHRFTSWSKMGA